MARFQAAEYSPEADMIALEPASPRPYVNVNVNKVDDFVSFEDSIELGETHRISIASGVVDLAYPLLQPLIPDGPYGPFDQPPNGASHMRTTFFVNFEMPTRHVKESSTGVVGQMYVEHLQPEHIIHCFPIVLIHGDWHTGQIWNTKPDGKPGWASFFVLQGYQVYIVDLPPCGRSTLSDGSRMQRAMRLNTLDVGIVERNLTAPAKQNHEAWPTAHLHNKWPGTGRPGDVFFENYCASLVPLPLKKAERQHVAQVALASLLDRTGKTILVGEGTGATMAWLAADKRPDLVAAVVAAEPAGPPAGTNSSQGPDGVRRFSSHIRFEPGMRKYGLADIPLTFDPSPNCAPELSPHTFYKDDGQQQTCILQHRCRGLIANDPASFHGGRWLNGGDPRKLVNLQQMRHAIVTAPASSHSTYDWATTEFLKQAGVDALSIKLEQYGIFGNGHLMFLETNSDEVASLISIWIGFNTLEDKSS
ncbi:hypothetical protein DCS_04588 [Drechmeria coniospora]|uniref:AB hydrolase-1 domain-containing protein n=1 Tax=Drechmeria coniospora TaxID=98403 RepID=A0A151GKF0_DRECN|nr:hypothetical protein DCS_04588 [Drechmeria coniospora]KYK57577.1 hypothetical protein DCS_04588 [Drechmeria coniospora]